ncbi:hypothetical protein OH76DRAFT_1244302 [Lentinus brumalis]|uniref:Uncharacterized protein n=1 Tax=Lentinus brumalis TaxID=2498619 RepID=A0A371CS05_9APHY|nr:hypothetical protein OH76DRAFT_1244302 [Polyporus brumalis]
MRGSGQSSNAREWKPSDGAVHVSTSHGCTGCRCCSRTLDGYVWTRGHAVPLVRHASRAACLHDLAGLRDFHCGVASGPAIDDIGKRVAAAARGLGPCRSQPAARLRVRAIGLPSRLTRSEIPARSRSVRCAAKVRSRQGGGGGVCCRRRQSPALHTTCDLPALCAVDTRSKTATREGEGRTHCKQRYAMDVRTRRPMLSHELSASSFEAILLDRGYDSAQHARTRHRYVPEC